MDLGAVIGTPPRISAPPTLGSHADDAYAPQDARHPDRRASRRLGRGADRAFRGQILKIDEIISHFPNRCSACNQAKLINNSQPYMGHHVLELETTEGGLKIVCQLHHYYQASCSCGHQSLSQPGEGITSTVEGRTRNLKLTEYVLVGNAFATLIASLGVRYRLSRSKI